LAGLPVGPWRAEDPVVAENPVATTMESMAFIGFLIVEQHLLRRPPHRVEVVCQLLESVGGGLYPVYPGP
jgi:hypothetical protein